MLSGNYAGALMRMVAVAATVSCFCCVPCCWSVMIRVLPQHLTGLCLRVWFYVWEGATLAPRGLWKHKVCASNCIVVVLLCHPRGSGAAVHCNTAGFGRQEM